MDSINSDQLMTASQVVDELVPIQKKRIIIKPRQETLINQSSNELVPISKKRIDVKVRQPLSIQPDSNQINPIAQLDPLSEKFLIRPRSQCKNRKQMSKIEIGDSTCWWVYDIIKELDIVSEIANISSVTNHVFDILVRLKSDPNKTIYGVQVRTMQLADYGSKIFKIKVDNAKYPADTLMIYVNDDRNYFVVALIKDIPANTALNVDFNYNDTHYESIKIINLHELKTRISSLIPQSSIVSDIREGIKSAHDLRSYNYIQIIKSTFENLGCTFEYENTTDSTIDIYLNGLPCQCKSTSYSQKGQLYTCSLCKIVNGITVPYKEGDFEYLIVQIIDENIPNKYRSDICIIPIEVLIDQGKIQTNTQSGTTRFLICPPRHYKYHWAENLWNNYKIILDHLTTNNHPIYQYWKKNDCIFVDISSKHCCLYYISICATNIKNYFMVFINDKNTRLYQDYIFIISKDDLIRMKKIPTNNLKYKRMYIAPPDYGKSHWSLPYWKKINDLINLIHI